MNQKLSEYIRQIAVEAEAITEDRRQILDQVVNYVSTHENPQLNFICTHNSRRSHLSQIWAQTLADHFAIALTSFSGGTEATAFHPNAVAALQRAGFTIEKEGEENPRYHVYATEGANPMVAFSKKYEDPPNPTTSFAAIMTCSEADADCPVVFGADQRIKLFYEDPKVADGTPQEASRYDERCRQIATEMYYVFSQIKV